ncbi:hypothetical protein KEM60_01478 [Austwickia sp. TVS 96-490-7B]|uniref:choice-of-anchor M domain-containing protein n=1 Tax=Austwickia sp. TVS 96-490-7B TaxID=2830843 RepID=UPI001C57BCC8|nr:choice-of-anchor M domain-containing protein [Austwickia sp. TVS 96-490-7B]MBW3085281.1 hypothetical protein [Austwickia sp. TVS 96-490-7B]
MTRTPLSSPTRRLLTVVAALPLLSLLNATSATAGPADGKTVAAHVHVDAPKTFWKNGTFALTSEIGGTTYPLAKTVNHLPKGYDEEGRPQYLFTVPDKAPELAFLGGVGKTWWMAPAEQARNATIWAGFGADTGIPANTFRDSSFSLDLLDVDGPGQVEFFSWYHDEGQEYGGLTRLLSSHDLAYRSSALEPGSHNHITTLFSKPGHYRLTFRTTARHVNGSLITSPPTTMDWQVGGPTPSAQATPSTEARYNAAPAGQVPASYTFAITDEKSPEGQDKAAAGRLSRWRFATGDRSTGTATVLIDGYHMADIPVTNGVGQLVQLPSVDAARYQVVYTPTSGGVRWISPEVTYRRGGSAQTTAAQGTGTFPQPRPDRPAPAAPRDEVTVAADRPYTATVEPGKYKNTMRVTVDFKDPAIRGFAQLGFYDKGEKYPTASWFGTIHQGKWETVIEGADSVQGLNARLGFVPHATMKNLRSHQLNLTDSYEVGRTYAGKGVAPRGTTDPARTPSARHAAHLSSYSGADAAPAALVQRSNTEAVAAAPAPGRLILDKGHLDLQALLTGNTLTAKVKDETGIAGPGAVQRDIATVALGVQNHAKTTRTSSMSSKNWDFLGPIGSVNYILPATQKAGLIWPGYSTETIDYSQLNGPVTLTLDKVSGPGDVKLFAMGSLGTGPSLLVDSSKPGMNTISMPTAAHVHSGWVFSKPGVYDVAVRYTAKSKANAALDSGRHTLRILVGKDAIDAAGGARR